MSNKISVEEILDLVKQIESEDPIDWGMLSIDEDTASELLVNQLVDKYNTEWVKFNQDEQVKIFLSSMGKLIIENFVLNVKLHQ